MKGKLGKNQWEKQKIKFRQQLLNPTVNVQFISLSDNDLPKENRCNRSQHILSLTRVMSLSLPSSCRETVAAERQEALESMTVNDGKVQSRHPHIFWVNNLKYVVSFRQFWQAFLLVGADGTRVNVMGTEWNVSDWLVAGHAENRFGPCSVSRCITNLFSSVKLLHYKDMFPLYKI